MARVKIYFNEALEATAVAALDEQLTGHACSEIMTLPAALDAEALIGLNYEAVRRTITDAYVTEHNRTPWSVREEAGGRVVETYKTKGRGAAARAQQLRRQGFYVTVTSIGPQQTGVGVIRMTRVAFTVPEGREIPRPAGGR